jgi:TPR repeat protein
MNRFIRILVIIVFSITVFGCVGTSDWQKKDEESWNKIIQGENERASELLSQGMYKKVANKQWIKLSDKNKERTFLLMNNEYKPTELIARFKKYKDNLEIKQEHNIELEKDLLLAEEYISSWIVQVTITLNQNKKLKPKSFLLIKNLQESRALLQEQIALGKLKLMAQQGDADSQYKLGSIYHSGKVVDRDDDKAIKWLKLAVEQGHTYAQYAYSVMYMGGYGVKQSWSDAFYWLKKTVEQGNREAYHSLANQYCWGLGTDASFDDAYKWYSKANEQGNRDASEKLSNIYEECGAYSKPSKALAMKIKSERESQNQSDSEYSSASSATNKNWNPSKKAQQATVDDNSSSDSGGGILDTLSNVWDNLNTQAGQNPWDTKLFRLGEMMQRMGTPYSQQGVSPAYRWMADDPNSGFNYSDYNRMVDQDRLDKKLDKIAEEIQNAKELGFISGNQLYNKNNDYMGYIKGSSIYSNSGQKIGNLNGRNMYRNDGSYFGYRY